MTKEAIVIRRETLYNLRDPNILGMVGLTLLGQLQEKLVIFFGNTESDISEVQSVCTRNFLAQFPNCSPNLYTTALKLAEESPYPAARRTALQTLRSNMTDWCVRDEKMPKSLWGKELPEGRQNKHIQEISFSLLGLGLTHPNPNVRVEAASTLSLLAQTAYDPKIGGKNPEKFNFLNQLLLLVEYEEDPRAAMDKIQAVFELAKHPQFKDVEPAESLHQIKNSLQNWSLFYEEKDPKAMKRRLQQYEATQCDLRDQVAFEHGLRRKEQGNWSNEELSTRKSELRMNRLILTILNQQYLNSLGIGPSNVTS